MDNITDNSAAQNDDFKKMLIDAENARCAAENKAVGLEAAVKCLSLGVAPEFTDDVIAVAASYKDCNSFDEAIDLVIKKYPFFTGAKFGAPIKNMMTGIHISPADNSREDGVEDAFRKANPTVKF